MDNIKILLAEDNSLNRKVILAMLDKMGLHGKFCVERHGSNRSFEKGVL